MSSSTPLSILRVTRLISLSSNLQPGGWIEQCELDIESHIKCDDATMPRNAKLRTYGNLLNACAKNASTPLDICRRMRGKIEAAGFINVQEKRYKIPIGEWAKHPIYKDAGKAALRSFKIGLPGWSTHLLTHHARPRWTNADVEAYLGELNLELDQRWHIYCSSRRVWAQKPFVEPVREVGGDARRGSGDTMMDEGSRTPQHYSH